MAKKRLRPSTVQVDITGNYSDNLPKKVDLNRKPDKIDKMPKSPPMDSDQNERGDMDLSNLQQKVESIPLKKLKQYNKVKK